MRQPPSQSLVDEQLAIARAELVERGPREGWPKALILPHAGLVYSGTTAALGYALLARGAGTVSRVLLLGPTHRVYVQGVATAGADCFETPLGLVATPTPEEISVRSGVLERPDVHAEEHSLEVHLPFIQTVLPGAEVVPLAVGHVAPEAICRSIGALWDGEETAVVVSSDLSHYHPYPDAQRRDAATIRQILDLSGPLEPDQACGAYPVNGLLMCAARHGLRADLLGSCNSGDTAGRRDRVVGYAAIAFWEDQP
ncbi:MAG: AmmeMemoRadiSam system protein B [Micrococcales bacterium]|nr:AmmeMemoRadiSam system protein B [Micrococcales bacterium]